MAVTLSITVTNAQGTRVQAAFGHRDGDSASPTYGQWIPATAAELQTMIKAWAKERVINYETTQAAEADRVTRSAEVW